MKQNDFYEIIHLYLIYSLNFNLENQSLKF